MESYKLIQCAKRTDLPKNRNVFWIIAKTLDLALEQNARMHRPAPKTIYQLGENFYFDFEERNNG